MPEITKEEQFILNRLREKGFAVCVFNEEELGGVSPDQAEEGMMNGGWNAIFFWQAQEENK